MWKRYAEAPRRYPNLPSLLDRAEPATDGRLFEETSPFRPRDNRAEEDSLRESLLALEAKTAPAARGRISKLESRHGVRRGWVWAELDRSPLARMLLHLAALAEMTEKPPGPWTTAEISEWYVAEGWRVDDEIAQALGTHDVIEYWKSSPYLLNFMKGYDLKRKLNDVRDAPPEGLADTLRKAREHLLTKRRFKHYDRVEPGNARLRTLMKATLDAGQWELLWMPPTLPYIEPDSSSAYARVPGSTKSLVFSSWSVVPDAISAPCSYEAERRMLAGLQHLPSYFELYDMTTQLLNFATDTRDRPARMSTLVLLYPSVSLASAIDPLQIALAEGGPTSVRTVLRQARNLIENELRATGAWPTIARGQPDQRWYWVALALLDDRHSRVEEWCAAESGWRSAGAGHDPGSGFRSHVNAFCEAFAGIEDLGRAPDDLVEVLAEFALASPAVCALRALRRIAPGVSLDDGALLSAACRIAGGFRTLFNLPESRGHLRASDDQSQTYWRLVLPQGLQGNLQAVLDEYAHTLLESLGLADRPSVEKVEDVADTIAEVLSLRTSHVKLEEIKVKRLSGKLRT